MVMVLEHWLSKKCVRALVEGFSGLSLVFQSHWSLVTCIHSVFVISLSDSFLKFNDSEQGLP